MYDRCYDAIVVGAGIVGVSTALHLLMRGKKVLLIDRRGAGMETSYGNAGLIETSCVLPYSFPPLERVVKILLDRDTMARVHYPSLPHSLPWIVDLYMESREKGRQKNGKLFRPLVTTAVDEHLALMQGTNAVDRLTKQGYCRLYRDEAGFAAEALTFRVAQEAGVPFEIMDPAAFREFDPDLKPIYHKIVRWTGSRRLTNPGAVVAAYADRFVREGGTFLQTDIRKLNPANGNSWIAETIIGNHQATNIVVCTGPWTTDILKPLGYHFPLGFKRGYHQHFSATGSAKIVHGITDVSIGYFLVPMEQGYRITTGAEFADRDAPSNPVQIERILPRARELFPLGEPVEEKAWLGSRPCFTDSLPVIGSAARHSGLWFNFGHGHLGLTMGPSSGRLLAEIMTGEPTFCDPQPYSAARFHN